MYLNQSGSSRSFNLFHSIVVVNAQIKVTVSRFCARVSSDSSWLFLSQSEESRCTQGTLHNFKTRKYFRTVWFDYIYPHNWHLFFVIPQVYVAADKNKIYNPVPLWNKHLPTCNLRTSFAWPRLQSSLQWANKICKQTFFYWSLCSLYTNLIYICK